MSSDQNFVDFICAQAGLAGRISTRKMFGEYALYVDGTVVAFVCDNHLFVKPTDAGRALLGTVTEAPAYPGSKLYFQVNEHLDERSLLNELLLTTWAALPKTKPKATSAKAKSPSSTGKAVLKAKPKK